jgi:quercetin dioxygenase-like cupin family protein
LTIYKKGKSMTPRVQGGHNSGNSQARLFTFSQKTGVIIRHTHTHNIYIYIGCRL